MNGTGYRSGRGGCIGRSIRVRAIVDEYRRVRVIIHLPIHVKTHLEKTLKEKYLWVPELGNKTRDIDNIQLVDEEKGLQKLLELAEKHEHIVLLCAEKKDEDCHRSYVLNRFLELLAKRP